MTVLEGGLLLADRILGALINLNFIKVIINAVSILSLRVRLRRAERFIKDSEEIAGSFPDEMGNLRVCFGFTSNCSASRNDRFFIEKFCCNG